MAFAKTSSWRFRQLKIVGCLVRKRLTKGVGGVPGTPGPRPNYSYAMNGQLKQEGHAISSYIAYLAFIWG